MCARKPGWVTGVVSALALSLAGCGGGSSSSDSGGGGGQAGATGGGGAGTGGAGTGGAGTGGAGAGGAGTGGAGTGGAGTGGAGTGGAGTGGAGTGGAGTGGTGGASACTLGKFEALGTNITFGTGEAPFAIAALGTTLYLGTSATPFKSGSVFELKAGDWVMTSLPNGARQMVSFKGAVYAANDANLAGSGHVSRLTTVGGTWEDLSAKLQTALGVATPGKVDSASLATDGDKLYVGVFGVAPMYRGLLTSTNGTDWTVVNKAIDINQAWPGGDLVATTTNLVSWGKAGVFHSPDSGLKWSVTPTNFGLGASKFLGAGANAKTVILSVSSQAGLWRSTDSGANFTQIGKQMGSDIGFAFAWCGTHVYGAGSWYGVISMEQDASAWTFATAGLPAPPVGSVPVELVLSAIAKIDNTLVVAGVHGMGGTGANVYRAPLGP